MENIKQVRCNHCMMVFAETDIIDINENEEELCPCCGKSGGLKDLE